jgi:Ca2+-binding protein (EF-Hand superfamily)
MAQKRQTSEQHIRDALNALDKDGDGLVSFKELAKDLSTIGACLKPDEINEIFADLEIDEDGNLSHDGAYS